MCKKKVKLKSNDLSPSKKIIKTYIIQQYIINFKKFSLINKFLNYI